MEPFEIFSQGRDLERCGDLSWRDLLDKPEDLFDRESEVWVGVPVVPNVTDVPVSVVTELCFVSPCYSGRDFVEPRSFSFSKKRAH